MDSLRKTTAKKVLGCILILALTFSFVSLPLPLYVLEANAYEGTNLYPDPATKTLGLSPAGGDTYTFDVMLENASDVITICFDLYFDTSKVNITDITIGDALPGGFLLWGYWDTAAGFIDDICVAVLATSCDVDNKTVVTITVEARDLSGSEGTVLNITDMACYNKYLEKFLSGDSPYDHTLYTVRAGTSLYADPATKTVGPKPPIGETYTFDVRLENASDVVIIAFDLYFDTSKVNITDIVIGDALPEGILLIGNWIPTAGYIDDITVSVIGTSYYVENNTVVTITVEAIDFTGPEGTVLNITDMACFDEDLFKFFEGDTIYDHTVKILPLIKAGILGPLAWMQGQGMIEGAEIAKDVINTGEGIQGRGIELVFADTLRGQQYPDNETGATAAMELVNAGCDFVIGGYWNETVFAAREVFMDNKTIFLISGASDDALTDDVGEDYARYKYLFRVAPTNLTMQAKALWSFTQSVLESKLRHLFGGDGVPDEQVRVAVVSENLTIWDEIHQNMTDPYIYPDILGQYANVTYSTRVSVNETDFSTVLQGINASRARLLIHLFSTQTGINFTKQWAESGIKAVPVGINMYSQKSEFWEHTEGKCEYETILAPSGTRTPLSAEALAFYDRTLSLFGHAPMNTAFGVYDAIFTMKEAIERARTTDSDAVVAELEQTDRASILGKFKFTEDHDVFCSEIGENWTEGYVRPLLIQWQKSPYSEKARLQVLWPRDQIFSRKWKIPTWVYSLAETDFNYDRYVNLNDIINYLAPAYGARAGDPGWNVHGECDIDGNGIVNMADVARFAKDWGMYGCCMGEASVGAVSSNPKITQADSTTMVYLDPATINGTAIGQEFPVNIKIRDASNVTAWEAGMSFNASLLECTDVGLGSFLDIPGATLLDKMGNFNNTSGEITNFGRCVMGNYSASGDGTLAYATFKIIETGLSDLHLRDAIVIDQWGAEDFRMASFNIIDTYTVEHLAAQISLTVSNSTGVNTVEFIEYGSGFYDHAFITADNETSFNVTGPYPGWSNATIPRELIDVSTSDQLLVIIDDIPLKPEERIITENSTHYFVYFNYTFGIHNICILKRPPVYNINANRYYTTIQEAINSAQSGDKILAFEATHDGTVVVNKSVSLIGENKYNTVIDGGGTGTVIMVTANNVNITGFTIKNSGNPECGILVDDSSGNNISYNIITDNYYGIRLVDSGSITLDGNDVSNNEYGILVDSSSNNSLTNNTMSSNKYNFGLYGTVKAHFENDIDISNTVDGKPVYYIKRASNTIYNASTNAGTFYLIDCDNVTIKNLTLTTNVYGVFLWNTTYSKIQNVNASSNENGIYLQGLSNNNNLTSNTISSNNVGIYLNSSNNNVIYHNSFIKNTLQTSIIESINTVWDNDYPSGGNYWSDYSDWDYFNGLYQNDTGNDGILDHAYMVDVNNIDHYPLISPLDPPVFNIDTIMAYTTIQEAVSASETWHGDTIIVRGGTYYEHVAIDKSLTLIGIVGNTVIDGSGTGTVLTITANNVVLRCFIIQGSGPTDEGILLSYANNTVISENTVKDNYDGIYLESSYNTVITGNILTNNENGIFLWNSSNTEIDRNNITENSYWGIYLDSSNDNIVYYNNFINNTDQVVLHASFNNTWDDGTGRGNYWSNYAGADDGSNNRTAGDGVGDTGLPHEDVDWYPLMNPWTPQYNDVTTTNAITIKDDGTPLPTVSRGYNVEVNVTIKNQGDFLEIFNVTFYINMTTTGNMTEIGTQLVYLPSGNPLTLTFTWDTTTFAYGSYTIVAYAWPVINETDTVDNWFTGGSVMVTGPADIDGNGKVEPADFARLSVAFGSTPWRLGMIGAWNPNCDLSGNKKVDPADFAILSAYFGNTYTYP